MEHDKSMLWGSIFFSFLIFFAFLALVVESIKKENEIAERWRTSFRETQEEVLTLALENETLYEYQRVNFMLLYYLSQINENNNEIMEYYVERFSFKQASAVGTINNKIEANSDPIYRLNEWGILNEWLKSDIGSYANSERLSLFEEINTYLEDTANFMSKVQVSTQAGKSDLDIITIYAKVVYEYEDIVEKLYTLVWVVPLNDVNSFHDTFPDYTNFDWNSVLNK